MITLNGHRLNLIQHGPPSGAAVILLHHGLGSARAWRRQLPALAHAGYHAIAYDRLGYGRSQPRESLDIPEFSQDQADLLALMDALGLERATLAGHSDGGTIAMLFSAAHPQRVATLITVAAHAYVEAKMEPGLFAIRHAFENDADFRQKLHKVHGDKVDSVFYGWFDGWARPECRRWDIRPVLARIACPALVVQGMEDEHATPEHARQIAAAIPGADLWLLPGIGHMLPRQAAAAFNRKLLEFLSIRSLAHVY
ncbi:MAG: alpha/beta fold hydrolase [Chloroflexi bacterium]|nr:alpha/beta fold hydrolase [Chloroflexota bacterium]